MREFGSLYATVPGNLPTTQRAVIGCHLPLWTHRRSLGEGGQRRHSQKTTRARHRAAQRSTQVITVAKSPVLKQRIGDDIITVMAQPARLGRQGRYCGDHDDGRYVDAKPALKHGTIAILLRRTKKSARACEKLTSEVSESTVRLYSRWWTIGRDQQRNLERANGYGNLKGKSPIPARPRALW